MNSSLRTDTKTGLNYFKTSGIRSEMSQSAAGLRVLEAADKGEINLLFDRGIPNTETAPPLNLYGQTTFTPPGETPTGFVYLWNNQNGRTYDLLGIQASGYEAVAGTATHEGLHMLGVSGSNRAEALVRLAELQQLGVSIDSQAMRQVLSDMRKAGTYNQPWRVGGSTPNFPGVKF
jgi:hypothetical protein